MKKVFVKKDDYDLYSIRLPFRFLFGRKRRNYIVRELEKVHPNYSVSSSAEDLRLSLGRHGIFADVAVVDRDRLSSYIADSRKNRRRLFLEGNPERKVFAGGGKKNLLRSTLVPLSLVAAAFAFRLAVSASDDAVPKGNAPVAAFENAGEEKASASLLAPQELFAAVLASVRSKHGRVTSLSWKDGRCSFAVTGCNSEDVAAAKCCVVSYSSGQPQFNFVTKVNDRNECESQSASDSESEVGFQSVGNIVPLVRKEIAAFGGDILSEKVSEENSTVSFVCEADRFEKILSSVSDCVHENGWRECSASVESDGLFSSVCISLKNAGKKSSSQGNPLSILSEYGDVFGTAKTAAKTSAKNASQRTFLVAENLPGKNRVRIGEIRKGGRTFVYYRSSDGRVSSEVVNGE